MLSYSSKMIMRRCVGRFSNSIVLVNSLWSKKETVYIPITSLLKIPEERVDESVTPRTLGLRELTAELREFKLELQEFKAGFERDLKRLQLDEGKNAYQRRGALEEFKAALKAFKTDHGKCLERQKIEAEKNGNRYKEFDAGDWRIFKTTLDGFHWKLLFNLGGVVMVVAPLSLAAYSMLGPAYFSMVIAALVLVNILCA